MILPDDIGGKVGSTRIFAGLLGLFAGSVQAAESAPMESCVTQSERVRVTEKGGVHELEVRLNQSSEWHRVLASKERIDLPRSAPGEEFIAYITPLRVRDKATPWIYLQRVSNGWREAVIPLSSMPKELCFSSQGTSLRLVDGSDIQTIDLTEQINLLTKRK